MRPLSVVWLAGLVPVLLGACGGAHRVDAPSANALAITGVSVVDVRRGVLETGRTVVVRGGQRRTGPS